MLDLTCLSQNPICPKCQRLASLRVRASLPEGEGFPKVECLECWGCGEVVVVERGLGERTEPVRGTAVHVAA
jgi:hypothetical protein